MAPTFGSGVSGFGEGDGPAIDEAGSSSADDGSGTADPTGAADDDDADEPSFDVAMEGTGAADGGEGDECPCQDVLDGIYVLNTHAPASVWFYDPLGNDFTKMGELGCAAPPGTWANSMAIDRLGNAWLNFYGPVGPAGAWQGWLFRAPLADLASCEMLDYQAQDSWYLMGMGYAVESEGSSCDTLYLYNSDDYVQYPDVSGPSELASWDEAGSQRVGIGATTNPVAELTGTGDGRLFAFANTGPSQSSLVRLDKSTGAELEAIPLGLEVTSAFAFAFWGGDVYFFTEAVAGVDSKVTRLDYDGNDGGGLTVVNPSAGLRITGAGVSTCASFTPPG